MEAHGVDSGRAARYVPVETSRPRIAENIPSPVSPVAPVNTPVYMKASEIPMEYHQSGKDGKKSTASARESRPPFLAPICSLDPFPGSPVSR